MSSKRRKKDVVASSPADASSSSSQADDDKHSLMQGCCQGVVQCFNNAVRNDWGRPWTVQSPSSLSGSGFIISLERRLIVTNAHVVSFARTFQVRRDGDFDKYESKILAVSHQVDLAIVTVENDAFWKGAVALAIGVSPRMQQSVDVVGYPMGGDGISITAGIVSRIDWGEYSHSDEKNLVVTVDAAINSGNSGGPALSGSKVVGVAFQSYAGDADNIGYIVPVEVLKRMLEDFDSAGTVAGGEPAKLRGFARFVPLLQGLENNALRKSLGMPDGMSGVLVHEVSRVSNMHGVLLPGDVIMGINGENVSNDGRIQRPGVSPIDFRAAVTIKLIGESISMTVLRKGKHVKISVLGEDPPRITPIRWYNKASYCLFAGLVFCPLHLHYNRRNTTGNIAYYCTLQTAEVWHSEGRKHERTDQQIIGLATILPHSLMLGYEAEDFRDMHLPLLEIDGQVVNNLADVHRFLKAAKGPWVTFKFGSSKVIVLPLEKSQEVTSELMTQHGISEEASPDVAVSNGSKAVKSTAPKTARSKSATSVVEATVIPAATRRGTEKAKKNK